MGKIILFYKYVSVMYPVQEQKRQRALCEQLGLKGRIILASEGINGTVGGSTHAIELYKKHMQEHQLFYDMDIKESDGESSDFPRLRVLVKNEIVNFGGTPVDPHNGGTHLTPQQTHELLNNPPKDLVVFDARNLYEADIGTFENAVVPPIQYFRDLPEYIDENLEQFKDKTVLMFCTGGIRCEKASAYLKTKDVAANVLQISGGIHRYVEQFPEGHFKGKNYVFDARISLKVTDDVLGSCHGCGTEFNEYTNCINVQCNKQVLACPGCITNLLNTCSTACAELVRSQQVKVRVLSVREQARNQEL